MWLVNQGLWQMTTIVLLWIDATSDLKKRSASKYKPQSETWLSKCRWSKVFIPCPQFYNAGEHFTWTDSGEFACGRRPLQWHLLQLWAHLIDSLCCCCWTGPVSGEHLEDAQSSLVYATSVWTQSLSCGPKYSLLCLFYSCWSTPSSSSFSLLLLSHLGFFWATFSFLVTSSSCSLPSHYKLGTVFPQNTCA